MISFGNFLNSLIEKSKSNDVAYDLGFSESYIQSVVSNKAIPSEQLLKSIISYFKLSMYEIQTMYKTLSFYNDSTPNLRYLVLSLDENNTKTLPLMIASKDLIDMFTSRLFNGSEEIRQYYEPIIDMFLKKHSAYIEKVKGSSGRDFRGRIVILEYNQYGSVLNTIEKRVLYSDYSIILQEAIKHKKVMEVAFNLNKTRKANLLTNDMIFEIMKHNYGDNPSIQKTTDYINNSGEKYFDLVRLILSSYMERRKEDKSLKTPLMLYKEYIKKNTYEYKESYKKFNESEININGYTYKSDENPFDNEELQKMNLSGNIPDEINFNLKLKSDKM